MLKMLFKLAMRFEENRSLKAIRMGFILLMPIVIINSFVLVLIFLPVPDYQRWLTSPDIFLLSQGLRAVHTGCMSYFSLLVAISISWGFARTWEVPSYHSIIMPALSSTCFLISVGVNSADFQPTYLGNPGMLSSLISTVLVCRLYLYIISLKKKNSVTMQYRIDPYLYGIISAAVPVVALLIIFSLVQGLISYYSGAYCFQKLFSNAVEIWFMAFTDSPLLAGNLFSGAVQLFWFAGIHGQNVLYEINDNYYGSLAVLNLAAQQMGDVPEYIITRAFNNTYLNMGGAGAMISFVAAIFIFSRDKTVRTIGKIAAIPSVFNVSEILNFGIPIILNPIFFIPFILVPLFNMTVAYYATLYNWVPIICDDISWVTPVFLSGYVATGTWHGTILQLGLLIVDFLLYAPFVVLNDKQRNYHFQFLVRALEQAYRQMETINEPLRLSDLQEDVRVTADLLISDLSEALAANRLFLLYQPQYDREDHFIGAEALIRWNHPLAGFIYPPLIIALAKAGGLLPELEQFIFRQACASIARLNEIMTGNFKISVNITGDSLKYDTLESTIQQSVQQFHIRPEELWIELTEQDAMESSPRVMEKLLRLRNAGHQLLIDDFGMGHTSITYLQTNIFGVVKLDASITRNVLEDKNSQEIIASIVSLSRRLHLMVVAEFVETAPQRDKLAEIGCDAFQGYLYSKPIPLADLMTLIKSR
jgi:lactose/cellobiose-specific phosphotransferase system IIC component